MVVSPGKSGKRIELNPLHPGTVCFSVTCVHDGFSLRSFQATSVQFVSSPLYHCLSTDLIDVCCDRRAPIMCRAFLQFINT